MAAALAKVLRGGRSGAASSQQLLPAMRRLILKEGVLTHLGTSPAGPTVGVGRRMHTGLWRQSVSAGTKLPEQQKLLNMYQFSSKRTLCACGRSLGTGPDDLPWSMLGAMSFVSLAIGVPHTVRSIWNRMKEKEEEEN